MEPDEIDLVRTSLRHLAEKTSGAPFVVELLASGWDELLAHDAPVAVTVLFEELGRARCATPCLDLVVLDALGERVDATTAVVMPALSRSLDPPASLSRASRDSTFTVNGLVLAGAERAQSFVVSAPDGYTRVPARSLVRSPISGLDPDMGWETVTGSIKPADGGVASYLPETALVRAARRALASELVGVTQAMLDMTVQYVMDRHQFKRPIASFQTVKHRLADVLIATRAAEQMVVSAWESDDDWTAMTAKAQAGRAFLLAATHCHQVHGGIAFTAEHPLHRYVKRGHALDALFTNSADLTWQLGQELLTTATVPRAPML